MYDKNERAKFTSRGQAVYEKLKSDLEPAHEGEIVAIHPESGDHFLGKTLNEADEKAFASYPDEWLYFVRLGSPEAALPLKTW
ncbi:MAG: hypothetical protein GTO63_28375 [Anaerolineae bacterium]|nr:hypothetical protein [Anaerolineae bacterium]NIN98653.1 hypothetical protein [Anaerolineae bacterium]NIQ81540.1 hypothetical protein [Anaerolineae bacterium]